MKYVQKEFSFIYEEKKSKFIAHLLPYDIFDDTMQRLKSEHPKARHFVYAYRYLNEFGQIVENSSDDGEPRGTSGKPSLAVLFGNELINTAVIIIRYFGGVKLGTGGLVRAYGSSVNSVINISVLNEFEILFEKKIECSYKELSKIEYLLAKLSIRVINKIFNENIIIHLELTKDKYQKLIKKLPINIKID